MEKTLSLLHKILLLFQAVYEKLILKKSNGYVVKHFASRAGTVYIKLAQMLAMQNIDNLFTEDDRLDLLHICDDVNPVPYRIVRKTLVDTYGDLSKVFKHIYSKHVGSASISQVHRAILKTGEEVVVKIKRKDIEQSIQDDMKLIYFVIKRFGWAIGLNNMPGTRRGIDFYMKWLTQETDFINEVSNIDRYSRFAKSVNGKVSGTSNIVLPKVYHELCRPDVIVMEYIKYPTISRGHYTAEQQLHAINSYIQLSFYAMLQGLPVVFHGDPHAGNMYIDDNGNLGFLDMGLLFELSPEDANTTIHYFLGAYFQKDNYLYRMLEKFMTGPEQERRMFRRKLKDYCTNIPERPITMYFMDLTIVCFNCSICPQDFLFEMAKAFVCLSGFDTVLQNNMTGRNLLGDQVEEFLRSLLTPDINKIRNLYNNGVSGLVYSVDEFIDAVHFILNE